MQKRFLLGIFVGVMLIYLGIHALNLLKAELAENAASRSSAQSIVNMCERSECTEIKLEF